MRITEVDFGGGVPVDAYGPGFFRIADAVHQGPLLILPGGPLPWTGWPDTAAILARAGDIDVLFVGMGGEIAPLAERVQEALHAAGIGVEVMATPPACRSYNVLLSEGRRVGLAALPV